MPRVACPTTEWVLTKKRLSVISKKKDDKSRGFLKVLPNRLWDHPKSCPNDRNYIAELWIGWHQNAFLFFCGYYRLSAALVPQLYLSWVEQILSSTQCEIPTIRAASLQQTKVTSVYAEQTREKGKHRRIHTRRHNKNLQVNNAYQNQSSVIRKN